MKRIKFIMAVIAIISSTFRLISGTEPAQGDPIAELAKRGIAWRSTNQLSLDSTNLLAWTRAMAEAQTNGLSAAESSRLVEAIESWFALLRERDFNSFLRFRRADSCVYDPDSNAAIYMRHAMGEKYKEIEALSASEKAKALFGVVNTFEAKSFAAGTLSLSITRITTPRKLDSAYRGVWLTKHYRGGMLIEHNETSPYKFAVTPQHVLQKEHLIKLAQTGGVLVSGDKRYAIPWYVTFFWSPSEEQWKPFEYFGFDAAPKSPDTRAPSLFF